MRRVVSIVMVVFFCVATPLFAAGPLTCTGTVTGITMGAGGEVYITTSYRADWMRLCSVEYEWQDAVGEVTCAMWSRNLTEAYLGAKQISVKYTSTDFTCANLPTWNTSIVPEYVRLKQ